MGSGLAGMELWYVRHTHVYQETVAFYRDALRLEIRNSWENPSSSGTLFEVGNGIVEILSAVPGQSCGPPAGAWLRIEVPDVGDVLSRVRAAGHPITMDLKDLPWGERAFKTIDPSGLTVSLFEKTQDQA